MNTINKVYPSPFLPAGKFALLLLCPLLQPCLLPGAAAATVVVEADAPGKPAPATLHGLFFEDINYAADGGLYAELVENRSFEHQVPFYAWTEVRRGGGEGHRAVLGDTPLNAGNPHFLRLLLPAGKESVFGVANGGYDGIALRQGERYRGSMYVRVGVGETAAIRVQLEDGDGKVMAGHSLTVNGADWSRLEYLLTSSATVLNARLVVLVGGASTVDLDMISLFPEKTFKARTNGLRADLAQALANLKPGFLRFPGGCIVEGRDFANMYRWKDTIGDVAERRQNWNLWQAPNTPQYHQTYGLGFFEYFQFSEDIGAEPVPVVNCGMCCQARGGKHIPIGELAPFVQDALDLIEFANGPVTSEWGAKRAAMGHPEPFGLKYLAVGNEQWQQEYFDRYEVFHRALKAKYPEIRIIGSAGPFASDAHWRFAWDKFNSGTPADIVDEHYYVPPRWLLENTDRYDRLDRNGPKIFVGEYAGHDGRARPNNLRAALAEAAYITGLWKNCDLVEMASYAPLFGKYGRDQWHPNLIWFDNTRVVLTPSYHVQALASQYRPDVVLPVTVTTEMIDVHPGGLIGVGSWNTLAEYKEIRVTGNDGQVLYESDFARGMDEWRTAGGQWSVVDGALRQGAVGEDIRAVTGDPSWTDYTLTLKARKLRGDEGFLILFQTPDIDNPVWWNLGGWRNTEHSFQGAGVVETHVPGSIEADRWYDIRIETAGGARAFLDGKLIQESKRQPVPSVYAAAGRNQGSGELILSVVNPTGKACPVEIRLQGARGVGSAQGVILNGAPDQVNSLGTPENVAPRGFSVPLDGATLTPTLPAFSAAWLRVKTE